MKNIFKIIVVMVFFAAKANGQCSGSFRITPNCDSNCTGAITVSVAGGAAPFSANINGGAPRFFNNNPFEINGLCGGVYNLHIQDSIGCSIDTTLIINQNSITIITDSLDQIVCGRKCGAIYVSSSGGSLPYSYLWSTGDQDPGLDICYPGIFTLTVTDAIGCSATKNFEVGSGPCCPPDTAANPIVCERSAYTYTAPFHAGSTYQWTFSSDSIHTINNNSVTVIWGSIQTNFQLAAISYTETFANGSQQVQSQLYWVTTAPLINLTSSPPDANHVINICKGQSVSFLNKTTDADNFDWDFGDGTNSNAQDVSHAYNNSGTYTIRFEASTNCGCAAVDSFTVNVSNSPGPDIVCRSIVCEGDTAVYSTSAVCNNYYWNATGGTIITPQPYSNNIQVVWNNGNGIVLLSVGNCLGSCTDTTFLNIPVLTANAGIAGNDIVCENLTYTYTVPFVPGTDYIWVLTPASAGTISGNGKNEITVEFPYAATSPANCILTVNYQNDFLGCGGTGTKNIIISSEISLRGNSRVCKNDSVFISASLRGFAGQFNFTVINPLGNISNYTGSGFYLVGRDTGYYSVFALPPTAATFCEVPDTLKIHSVTTPPVDSISGAKNICLGNTYTYTANGALPGHYLIWGAKGGTVLSASGLNKTTCNVTWNGAPPHVLYCLQHDVNGNNCKSDTVFYSVNEVTSASINGPSNVCVNGIYNYDIIVPDMPDAYYEWTVTSALASIKSGQGTKQVQVEFHNAVGTATVQCTLKHCSLIAAVKNNIVVSSASVPTILPAVPEFCNGNSLSIQSSPATTYQWKDSLNNIIGTSQSVMLTSGGNHSLITTDANQCRATLSFYATENPSPEAILTSPSPNVFCIPIPVNATLYAVTNPGFTYQWLNNSAAIPGATSPVLNTTQTGSYQVLITNNFGCTALSNTFPVSISPCSGGNGCTTSESITANIVNDNCNPISFSGFASAGVSNLSWNFGDPASGVNNTSTLPNPSHLYSKPGYYFVFYSGTVTNLTPPPPSCLLTDTTLATVLGSCDFDSEPACAGLPTQFNNLSLTLPGTTVSLYTWNFGDGNSSSQQNPQHVYQNTGTYTVTLTITYATCTSVSSHQVTIPGASASFAVNPTPTCKLTPVQFILTNNGSAPLIAWQWNFGDGISSLNFDPVRAYDASGNFTATLIVTDSKGCTDTVGQNIFVNPSPVPGVITPAGPVNICNYNSIVLTAPAGASYLWSSGSTVQTFQPVATGNYFVEVTDANNCIYTTAPVEVNISESPVATIKGISEICYGRGTTLTASSGASLSYEWHELPSNQIISATGTYNITSNTSAGSYLVYLIEKDNTTNCIDTSDIFTVNVHANPPEPVIISIPSGTLCAGNNTILEVTNPVTNGIYLWSNGQELSYNNVNNPDIDVMRPGDYSVNVTDSAGCKAGSNVITINPPLDFSSMVPGCYELCDTLPNLLRGINCTDGTGQWIDISQQPPAVVSTNIDFYVTQSGIYQYVCSSPNCSDTSDAIDVTIRHCCRVEPPYSVLTYSNDTIFSSVTGSGFNYAWLLNNKVIPGATQPRLMPVSDGCYTLQISDIRNCNTSSNTLCFVFTGIVDLNQLNEVVVFPNPASDFIQFRTSLNQKTQLKITDLHGRLVFENVFKSSASVNIENFAKGVYAYTISSGNKKLNSGKIVIE